MNDRIADVTFRLVHTFNAPKKRVFNAFANADSLNAWWGPVETRNIVVKLDFRPGGIFHFRMESKGKINYGRFLFSRIEPFDLLEFTNAFADANAKVIPAPFDFPFPLEIFYRFKFTEDNGKTTITLTGQPVNASPEEIEGFRSIERGMEQGFGGTFKALWTYLENQSIS
jgi:uncharacterized protein YndB with AHSA1/START domain